MMKEEKKVEIPYYVDNNNLLNDKVALICGGTGCIGLAITESFLQSGCKVIISGSNVDRLTAIEKKLNNPNLSILQFDFDNIGKSKEFVEKAATIYSKIDIFVNASGVHTTNADFWKITPEEFTRVMDINLKGAYFLCQPVGEYMVKNQVKGHILVISSSRGDEPAWSPYGVSKWGEKGMVEGIAKMFASYGIVVNSIAPGSTASPMVGYEDNLWCLDNVTQRYVTPEEIANLAKFMVSDMGNMIIGDTVRISGGRGCFDIR